MAVEPRMTVSQSFRLRRPDDLKEVWKRPEGAVHTDVTPALSRGDASASAVRGKESGMPGQARHDEGALAGSDQKLPFLNSYAFPDCRHSGGQASSKNGMAG